MRELIYIPTLHGIEEMHDPIFFGQYQTPSFAKQQNILWDNIVSGILNLQNDVSGIKMYSEACTANLTQSTTITPLYENLPMDFTEIRLKQLELIRALYGAGAIPMITESDELLKSTESISEMQLNFYRGLTSGEINPIAGNRIIATLGLRIADCVDKRDQAISNNIDSSLLEGETGLLILGVGHDVSKYLPDTINFRFLSPALETRWELYQHHQTKERARKQSFIETSFPSGERIF